MIFRSLLLALALTKDFPDPCIIKVGKKWWAFATENGAVHIQIAWSYDFETWNLLDQDALPSPPPWVNMTNPNTWAPDVNELEDGTFVMYFSATTIQDSSKHCIGAAIALFVEGPYIPITTTMACPLSQGGAIDSSGFKDWKKKGSGWGPGSWNFDIDIATDVWNLSSWWGGGWGGQRYVVYKIDGNSIGNGNLNGTGNCGNTIAPIVPTPIILQALLPDGITPIGPPITLLNNAGLSDSGVIEAPSLIKSWSGTYFLFFSSGCYDTDTYTVSYATAPSITGPYTRRGALLKTGDAGSSGAGVALQSPGGADVYWDNRHMVFHATTSAAGAQLVRELYVAEISVQGTTVLI
ncbi:glycoside hydrolase family 43 protein [Saccharata proteae CBS 121410]|uniref:Glycoside hydrolase family 43 protein n=1 Tax=Saccharata proteae CBS 121410 TaxID=1314787 RepID=A0A9P4LXM8_9PEZI|nr:glycoside hydrolase family 43 protein [Saccharata proteae CBS 121410]